MATEEFRNTIEQRYLENPNICPFCGSVQLSAHHPNFNDDVAWRDVECHTCARTWTEKFKLYGIDI